MSDPRPRILVTNDDGIHSAGLTALAKALSRIGDVWVVAPDRERTADRYWIPAPWRHRRGPSWERLRQVHRPRENDRR